MDSVSLAASNNHPNPQSGVVGMGIANSLHETFIAAKTKASGRGRVLNLWLGPGFARGPDHPVSLLKLYA